MIRKKLSSSSLKERIITCIILFFIVFIFMTVLSYFILPEGFLKSRNSISDFGTSENVFISSIQIFSWNFLSVIIIFLASLFSKRKISEHNYLSMGYIVFFGQVILYAMTLGTWSFTAITIEAPSLIDRMLRAFNIFYRSGLWEMFGLIFITCAIAHISVIRATKKEVVVVKFKNIRLEKTEAICVIIGLMLMLIGSFVESLSILLMR